MVIREAVIFLAVAMTWATTQSPCACPKNRRPVCGSDGITYGNICTFRCKQASDSRLTLRHEGECENLCNCSQGYDPVCSTKGKTYHNLCALNCAKSSNSDLELDHQGECKANSRINRSIQKRGCPCTKELRYVCGSDEQTYHNPCLLKCAAKTNPHLQKLHEGKCKQNTRLKRSIQNQQGCPCTKELREVCGNDGRTYNNPCLLECATKTNSDLEKLYDGPCVSKLFNFLQPWCICTYQIEYVCGTDGVTYDNPCLLECAALTNPRLAIAYREPCKHS